MDIDMKPTEKLKSQRGVALILVLGILAVLAVLATTFSFNMRLEQKAAKNYVDAVSADCIAKLGIEHAIALLRNDVDPATGDCEGYDWNWDTWGYGWDGSSDESHFSAYDGTHHLNLDDYNPTVSNPFFDDKDARWIGVRQSGVLVGRYAVLVIDEASKMNINSAGNATNPHNSNEGWTISEMDLGELHDITASIAVDIVEHRYGSDHNPGDTGDDDEADEDILMHDGIDNDGDSLIDSDDTDEGDDEPDEFTPWYPRGDDEPFSTITQIRLVPTITSTIWDNVKNLITVNSRTRNQYWDSGSWKPKININAVAIAKDLYDNLDYDGIGIADLHQKVCNIMDYRDDNFVLSTLYNTAASTWIYGVEPILINEVLGKSHKIDNTIQGPWDGGGNHPVTYSGFAPNTCYRLRITSNAGSTVDFTIKVGTDPAGETIGFGGGTLDYASSTTTNLQYCISGGTGNINVTIVDPDPPDGSFSGVDSVEFTCAEFVELCNASDENINLTGWTIDVGSGDVTIPAGESFGGNTNWISARSYYVLTNDEELFDYSYGAVPDGSWGGAGESIPVVDMSTAVPAPDDWATGYATPGEFAETCNVDIVLKNEYGFCADLASNNETGRYGNSPRIGVSMEKIDPTVRDSSGNNWDENNKAASPNEESSPGADNNRFGVHTLSEIEIKNHPFASVGEMSDASKYKGVRSGTAWIEIPGDDTSDDLGKFAERITVDAVRLDAEIPDPALFETNADGGGGHWNIAAPGPYLTKSCVSTDGNGLDETSYWEWQNARLQPVQHTLYIYGLYTNDTDADYLDVRIWNYAYTPPDWDAAVKKTDLEYEPSDGLKFPVTITKSNISSNGSFKIELKTDESETTHDVYFDYLLLVPQSTLGKVNINTAWVDVLAGLPGIDATKAQAIYDNDYIAAGPAVGDPFQNIGMVLDIEGIDAAEFAPISNLISVHSDVFKIICLAQAVQPYTNTGGMPIDPGAFDIVPLAEKKIEVIVDRSTSPIRILSWKEITE